MSESTAFLEYVWLDRQGIPRSKVKTMPMQIPTSDLYWLPSPDKLPLWNFDGSSTGQNIGPSTEAVLKPVRVYPSPLDQREHDTHWFLVLCQLDLHYNRDHCCEEVEDTNGGVRGFNTRRWAEKIAEQYADEAAWFGCEQEYIFLDPQNNLPYGWAGEEQGNYYCSVRYPYCQLDDMVREHLKLAAQMGIQINGFNAEVAPSQWEFQVGPANLLKVADDLVMARYLLFRLSARYRVKVDFHPKPIRGSWNGSGCHINFSTRRMREPQDADGITGLEWIERALRNLGICHQDALAAYGDNKERLTGQHETSSAQEFTSGIGTRDTSVRIPEQVHRQGCGYLEDRRPASNIDPYLALATLLKMCLSGPYYNPKKDN